MKRRGSAVEIEHARPNNAALGAVLVAMLVAPALAGDPPAWLYNDPVRDCSFVMFSGWTETRPTPNEPTLVVRFTEPTTATSILTTYFDTLKAEVARRGLSSDREDSAEITAALNAADDAAFRGVDLEELEQAWCRAIRDIH